jgi:hypothetical protein
LIAGFELFPLHTAPQHHSRRDTFPGIDMNLARRVRRFYKNVRVGIGPFNPGVVVQFESCRDLHFPLFKQADNLFD